MIEKEIEKLIFPIADNEEIKIYKINYKKEGNDNFLEIMIENETFSIDLETCERFSEKISPIIEESNIIKESYYLDVCSPGSEREYVNENLEFLIDKHVDLKTDKSYLNDENTLSGQITYQDKDLVKVKVNLKGRMKDIDIERKDITSIRLAYKI